MNSVAMFESGMKSTSWSLRPGGFADDMPRFLSSR